MSNLFQHVTDAVGFGYSLFLFISYSLIIALTLTICESLNTILSDSMIDFIKKLVSSICNAVFNYVSLQPRYDYLNETKKLIKDYKNKKIKSIYIYYKRVPKKVINIYNKMTMCNLKQLHETLLQQYDAFDRQPNGVEYLETHSHELPFHCGLIFKMENDDHLLLDKTSVVSLLKLKELYVKGAVIKEISIPNDLIMSLGSFIQAGKHKTRDEEWFNWDPTHNCFYMVKRLLIKNKLYSQEMRNQINQYGNQIKKMYDASKKCDYSKNLEVFVNLQCRMMHFNLEFITKLNNVLMHSFN
jgi:hypothetical protein